MKIFQRKYLPWIFHTSVAGIVAYGATDSQFLTQLKAPEEKSVTRTGSDTSIYERSALYKDKFQKEHTENADLKEEMGRMKQNVPSDVEGLRTAVQTGPVGANSATTSTQTFAAAQNNSTQGQGGQGNQAQATVPSLQPISLPQAQEPQIRRVLTFDTSMNESDPSTQTMIPAGSYVKARILTGVEASPSGEPPPMLLQADYAFEGPNKRQIDMSGCFVIAMVKGNLSTERVTGQAVRLSCIRNNGEAIKREISGYLVGEDSTFGLTGQLISRQGQVFTAAVIANLAKGVGEAVSLANSKTTIAATTGAIEKATSVDSKDRAAFVGGKSVAGAAEMIAQWYLNQAQSLTPSIAVGSGRDIWVVMLDSVLIPPLEEREF